MPANTDPIFTKNVRTGSVLATAANTSSQGGGTIGTDMFLVVTADATNGSLIRRIRLIPTATAPTATTATVGRLFISTVSSGATTSANTFLFAEVVLPVINADNATSASLYIEVAVNDGFTLQAGHSILFSNHAAPAANSAWRATALLGDF